MFRQARHEKDPKHFGRRRAHRRWRRQQRFQEERAACAPPQPSVRATSDPTKSSCILEATEGPCRGRLLPFPEGLTRVVVVPSRDGRVTVRPVANHPQALGYYLVDRSQRGLARFVPRLTVAA